MEIYKNRQVEWLGFPLFENLAHGVFLRKGGESKNPYDSLNVSYDVGDAVEAVSKNLFFVKESLGIQDLVWAKQVHGNGCKLIDQREKEMVCDAMITNKPGLALMIKHADCQAAIFYDPIEKAVGVAHAGWKGSMQNIYAVVIDQMHQAFTCKPENILVGISPSLGPENAEFVNYKNELPENFWDYQIRPNYFDFWEISRQQLLEKHILPEHIEIAKIDTYVNPEKFFSYRRDKVTGRNGTIVVL